MLRKLTIENFFSVNGPETLDLEINRAVEDIDKRFAKPIAKSDARFPRVVALYGANASGKTNVLRAINFLSSFISSSSSWEINDLPHFFSFAKGDGITRFRIEVDARIFPENHERSLLVYDLEMDKNHRTVGRETLRYYPNSRSRLLFDRCGDEIKAGDDFDLPLRDPARKRIRHDVSVISTLAQFNHRFSRAIYDVFFILSNVRTPGKWNPGVEAATDFYRGNIVSFSDMKRRIKSFDTGILDIDIVNYDGRPAPLFKHDGLDRPITFPFESQGTQNFYNLFPIMDITLRSGGFAILDELDSDIHPHLLLEIVRWFQDPETNPHDAQLIFSCHNPSLLEHLSKEEVYLTEKDSDGQTHVFGVKDIKGVRRDVNLYEKYLAGAFGGVPRLG
jgi:hypothetical protein